MAVDTPTDNNHVLQPAHLNHTAEAQMSKKGQPWTEAEHVAFLAGLKKLGKGNWRGISKYYVPSRTPTQVASHAQKHFMRLSGSTKRKSRFAALEETVIRPCTETTAPNASPITSTSAAPSTSEATPAPQTMHFSHPACLMPPMFFPFPGHPPPFFLPFLCPPPPPFAKGMFFPMMPPPPPAAIAALPEEASQPAEGTCTPSIEDTCTRFGEGTSAESQQRVCRPSAVLASSGIDSSRLVEQLAAGSQVQSTLHPSMRSAFRSVQAV